MIKSIFYSVFIFSVVSITLIRCGDDDDNEFSIIGSWTLTQENTSACNDPLDNETSNEVCTASDCETITFDGNGGFVEVKIDNGVTTSVAGTYQINGNSITLIYTVGGDTDRATFTVNASALGLTYDQEGDGCIDADTYIRI